MPNPNQITQIRKRDGRIVDLCEEKITEAVWKAMQAVGKEERGKAEKLSREVIDSVNKKFHARSIPAVEEIQDLVEEILISNREIKTAKAYIIYREQRTQIRQMKKLVDSNDLIDGYLNKMDWRIKENSNMAYSLQGLNNHVAAVVSSHYWLDKIYPREIKEAHESGDLHIHDLQLLSAYCCGWDLQDLLRKGFRGVSGKIESKPAKHLHTALGQAVNFIYTLQGEVAGAQAFSSFDTLLAPFIRRDGLNFKEVKQALQEFVFNVNVPTRVGFQSPFSNITLDLVVPDIYKKESIIIGGEPQSEKYGEFQAEMDLFNEAFAEVMLEGDAKGRVFTFPIPTYNITKDFDWTKEAYKPIWEMTARYGIPYFSNFINSEMKPDDVRSMCCRLRLSNRELRQRGGGLFGANPLTGCYDEETEILTESGWKLFKDLTRREKVFTLTKDNKIALHKPKKLFKYDWEGEMYRFQAKFLDLLVTPNHRMVVDDNNIKARKFVEAQNFIPNTHRIPKQSLWVGQKEKWFILPDITFIKYGRQGKTSYQVIRDSLKIEMNDWLRFFGFWLAEGSTDNTKIAPRYGYRVVITQKNRIKRKEIKKVLDSLPFNYYEEKNNLVICNKQLWTYLRQFGDCYKKFIPQEIKMLDKEQLKILFKWLVKGNGHIRKSTGQINYWTASKKLADDIQEIILKLGFTSTISTQKGKISFIKGRQIKANITYCLGVQKSKRYCLRERNIRKEFYKGKIYCCEVTNNTVLVRRNGKITWCGNSIGVVTLNMARLGYLSETKEEFFKKLEKLMDLAKRSLEIKREILEKFTERGLYPYCKYYLAGIKERFGEYWRNHFNTIGLIGLNEGCLNFKLLKQSLALEEGHKFAEEVLSFMRERLMDYQLESNNLFNLEATPGEGTSYRLARMDKEKYPEIVVANENGYQKNKVAPYYTNSSQLPVDHTDDIFEALDLQDSLQTKYTGGTVLHGFIGEKMISGEATKSLVRRIAENYHLPYYTITPTFSICPKHGYLAGEHFYCPKCDEDIEYVENNYAADKIDDINMENEYVKNINIKNKRVKAPAYPGRSLTY